MDGYLAKFKPKEAYTIIKVVMDGYGKALGEVRNRAKNKGKQ